SLDPATIRSGNQGFNSIGVFVNGAILPPNVFRSTDNRTLVLNTTLPAGAVVSVVVTHEIKDLSGNALPDFVGAFTTAVADTNGRPQITRNFPTTGANGVLPDASVVLFATEALNAATVPGAVRVSQNGALVAGTTTVGTEGQIITFRPTQPFARGALIETFV